MCAKIPYETEKQARDAAKGMSRQHKGGMHHYWCKICAAWHLATNGKKHFKLRVKDKYPYKYEPKRTD